MENNDSGDTAALPPPLTPPDCDLTDFKFMPVDCQRLRDSQLNSDQTPEENWAAFLLWLAAWHQIPAGSIPGDSEDWIAQKANYKARGRIDERWSEVRNGALRGFIRCSDGRLYHPVVAEKALDAWQEKLQYAYDRLVERTRKANKGRVERDEPQAPIRTIDWWISAGRPTAFPVEPIPPSGGTPPEVPPESPPPSGLNGAVPPLELQTPSGGSQADSALKGQGQGQGQGQGLIEIPEVKGGPALALAPPPPAFLGERNLAVIPTRAVVLLDPAWELPTAWGSDAEALGHPPKTILHEAEKFRQYYVAGKGNGTRRSVKGWRQAWSNWLANTERFGRRA